MKDGGHYISTIFLEKVVVIKGYSMDFIIVKVIQHQASLDLRQVDQKDAAHSSAFQQRYWISAPIFPKGFQKMPKDFPEAVGGRHLRTLCC